jgi:hypothetical protein
LHRRTVAVRDASEGSGNLTAVAVEVH